MYVRRQRGLTFIELMLVVAIITMLAAIAVPNFVKIRQRVRATSCGANMRIIRDALHRYAIDYGLGPGDTAAMDALVPEYLKVAPECPSGGTYSWADVVTDPACDVPGHAIP